MEWSVATNAISEPHSPGAASFDDRSRLKRTILPADMLWSVRQTQQNQNHFSWQAGNFWPGLQHAVAFNVNN